MTLLVPLEENNTPDGSLATAVWGVASLPKSQLYDQLAPVLPVLEKFTLLPTHTGAVEVKLAVGF